MQRPVGAITKKRSQFTISRKMCGLYNVTCAKKGSTPHREGGSYTGAFALDLVPPLRETGDEVGLEALGLSARSDGLPEVALGVPTGSPRPVSTRADTPPRSGRTTAGDRRACELPPLEPQTLQFLRPLTSIMAVRFAHCVINFVYFCFASRKLLSNCWMRRSFRLILLSFSVTSTFSPLFCATSLWYITVNDSRFLSSCDTFFLSGLSASLSSRHGARLREHIAAGSLSRSRLVGVPAFS
mmetsp:Transcript_78444/g.123657  ORF Transcript_78444/g.123657 Transcript_78444/m.123657 type:complete len:241 (-) Transcript_78444:1586-2308(-)